MGQGGAEKIICQLGKSQIQNGDKVWVMSSGGVLVEYLESIGASHIIIPDMERKNFNTIITIRRKLKETVNNYDINVVHTHHRMAAFYASFLSGRISKVYTSHNVFFKKKILTRLALRNTAVVAVGDGVKQNLIDVYGINEEKIEVIYNAIDTKTTGYKNPELDRLKQEGYFLVGTVGRLSDQKGIDIFISAISKSIKNNPQIYGVVVGDGELKDDLEVQARKQNANVLFLGYQKYVLDIIRQLDLVVLSSRWEGLPLVPIESFSQGKTIVVSDISGNNEIVQNGKNGLLAEKDNSEQFAEKIEFLVNNQELRKQYESNGKLFFEENFSDEKMLRGYEELYQRELKRIHKNK